MNKLSVKELTRLAFVWAEQDRSAMADAWPAGSKERANAESEHQQLRAYRLKKFGRTVGDKIFEGLTPVSLASIARRK